MKRSGQVVHGRKWLTSFLFSLLLTPILAFADTLDVIKERGVLLHLAVPYAGFNTGSGDGLDIELVQGFAKHLGVRYQYVSTTWDQALPDLLGAEVIRDGAHAFIGKPQARRGDILASGVTRLGWREDVVQFSDTTFPSSVWLMAKADSKLQPIRPTHSLQKDIALTKALLSEEVTVLAKLNTCLDASLYDLASTGGKIINTDDSLNVNEMAPAVIHGRAESTLLDVADAMIALDKWAGLIKVLGPISEVQEMAAVFHPEDDSLREAFNQYFKSVVLSGEYRKMVAKYFTGISDHFPDFFNSLERMNSG